MTDLLAATLAGGLISSAGQIYQNQQNIQANNARYNDQVNLANSAHQREVLDLQAAGLNPILSASGSGSAVPSLGAPEVGNVTDELGRQVSAAGRLAALDYPLKESQIALNSAQAENLRSDGVLKRVQADYINRGSDIVHSGASAVENLGESFGDKVGHLWNDIFGPKEHTPLPSPRAVDRRLQKDENDYNKIINDYRKLGLPNRVRTPRKKRR